MKRIGAFLLIALILAGCGRSETEVSEARETAVVLQQTSVANQRETLVANQTATAAAMPTVDAASAADATPTAADVASVELPGDPALGQILFNSQQTTAQGVWMCSQCHAVDANRLIGPGLGGLVDRAGTRVEGQTAVEYVHESIVNPQAHVVQGDPVYPENLMPQNYGEIFSEEDLNNLIAYLLSL